MTTWSVFFVLSLILTIHIQSTENKQKIKIYGLSALWSEFDGGYITGAQRLAANDINNRSDILEKYEIDYGVLNTEGDKTTALTTALFAGSTQSLLMDDNSTILIPILLGAPFHLCVSLLLPHWLHLIGVKSHLHRHLYYYQIVHHIQHSIVL